MSTRECFSEKQICDPYAEYRYYHSTHERTCYDLFFHYFPYGLFTWLVGIIYPLVSFVYGLFTPGTEDYSHMLLNIGLLLGSKYFPSLLYGILTVIREHKHIRCGAVKTILYTFLYPWFTLISVYIYIVAVFVNVRWTPIVHNDSRTITDLHTRKDGETP